MKNETKYLVKVLRDIFSEYEMQNICNTKKEALKVARELSKDFYYVRIFKQETKLDAVFNHGKRINIKI